MIQENYNLEVEQLLIGSLLVEPNGYDAIADKLLAEHFYLPLHKEIYSRFVNDHESGKLVTPALFKDYFTGYARVMDLPAPEYITQIAQNVISTYNNAEYAERIISFAQKRMIQNIIDTASSHLGSEATALDVVQDLERELNKFTGDEENTPELSATDAHKKAMQRAQDIRAGKIKSLSTGFKSLDNYISGFYGSRLYVLAARPGMGKTALALNLAESSAEEGSVLFISLEMSDEELAMRLIARRTGISVKEQESPHSLSDNDFFAMMNAEMPRNISIRDKAGISIDDIALAARRHKRKHGLKALFIDYLGLIRTDMRHGSRNDQIAEITKTAKQIAKDMDVPVILLSQLNRGLENRDDKRPQLSDLRDSGAIEQDADVVMFIYREEYYLNQKKSDFRQDDISHHEQLANAAGKAEIIIAKHRQGRTGTALMQFDGVRQEFKD